MISEYSNYDIGIEKKTVTNKKLNYRFLYPYKCFRNREQCAPFIILKEYVHMYI